MSYHGIYISPGADGMTSSRVCKFMLSPEAYAASSGYERIPLEYAERCRLFVGPERLEGFS